MEKRELLYEGKAKKVFVTDDKETYLIEYKDDATAFNAQKRGTIADKGVVNNKMTAMIFSMLEAGGVPTHFIRLLNDREQLVKAVRIIPLEVIVRNIAAGSMAARLGLEEGTALKKTVFEICFKDDALGDPLINDDHAVAIGLAQEEDLAQIRKYTMRVNELLCEFFLRSGLNLVDFKIEFGKMPDGTIILADEISPDTCRLWDVNTGEKMDKDRFRRDLGNVEETYQEVLRRLSSSL